ncbi:MAG: hypothetical protein ACHQ5A_09390, partial [Opitutales bacterium]
MQARGWTRMVGVADNEDTVLIYVPADGDIAEQIDICLAVVSGRDLVVVSTRLNSDGLAELIAQHIPADLRAKLHLARR